MKAPAFALNEARLTEVASEPGNDLRVRPGPFRRSPKGNRGARQRRSNTQSGVGPSVTVGALFGGEAEVGPSMTVGLPSDAAGHDPANSAFWIRDSEFQERSPKRAPSGPLLLLLLSLLLTTGWQIPTALHPWLGTFEAPPEKVTLSRRSERLWLQMDLTGLPVDGQWHVTFETYGVRQRATWIPQRQVIRLDEQHNYKRLDPDDESGWQFELRLDTDGETLLKVVQQPSGEELVLRRYVRIEEGR